MINYKQKYEKYKKKYLNLKNIMSGGVGPQADTVEHTPQITTIKCTMIEPCDGHNVDDLKLYPLLKAFMNNNIQLLSHTFIPHGRTTFFCNVIAEDIESLYGQIINIPHNCSYRIERLVEDETEMIGLIIAYKTREEERRSREDDEYKRNFIQNLLRMPQPYEIPPDINMDTIPCILKLAPGELEQDITLQSVRNTLQSRYGIIPRDIRIINPKTIYIDLFRNDYDHLRTYRLIIFEVGEGREIRQVRYQLFLQKDYEECGVEYNEHRLNCSALFGGEHERQNTCRRVANAKYDKCIIKAKSII